jgi:UDP-N-acetylmuramate--alanine ligase
MCIRPKVRMKHGSYEFDVLMKDWILENVILNMGGMHNVENVSAAITVAHQSRYKER